jgi:hypothetical protein
MTAEGICPVGTAELPRARFIQGADRRFAPVTLP